MQIIRFIIILAARQREFWGFGWVPPNGRAAALSAVMPPAAPFLAAQKWGKKPPAPFGLDPRFCPIGRKQVCRCAATEFLRGLRPPRNRCGECPTSPDGPRAEVHFVRWKNRFIYPFKRATAEAGRAARRRSDAKTPIQWQGSIKSDTGQLGKQRGPGSPWRLFGDFLCVQKVTRVRGGEPREPKCRSG